MIVYKTTNLVNGKIYIGQDSKNNEKYIGSGNLLILAIKKYGYYNFQKEILEFCSDKYDLDVKEKLWIKYFNSTNKSIGYNISEGGTGGKLVPFDAKKGKTYEEYYGEEKALRIKNILSEKRKYVILPNMSYQTKYKISQSNTGRVRNDDVKEAISISVKKYFESDSGLKARENLRLLKTNSILTEPHKISISNTMKDRNIKPKKLDVHPSSKYWYFYDSKNTLILEILGGRTKALKELQTNQRRIVIFYNLIECLEHNLENNKDYKVFTKKYYN